MKYLIIFFLCIAVLFSAGFYLNNNKAVVNDPDIISRTGIHWHPQIAIYVNDELQEIPEGLGLTPTSESPIHTHDDVPLIHLEFDGIVRKSDITLGKFFEVWGKPFSSTELLGNTGEVHMFVNGEPNTEFGSYVMHDDDKIELRINTVSEDSTSM